MIKKIHPTEVFILSLFFLIQTIVYGDQEDRIVFNHSFHIEDVELRCEECHNGVGSNDKLSWDVFPEMDLCLNCHDGGTADDDCEKCHTNADEPLAISDSWMSSGNNFSHKSHFNYINDCQKCHNYIYDDDGTGNQKIWQDQECNECHSKHEYTSSMTTCTNCHTDFHKGNNGNECQDCHTPSSWTKINAIEIHQTTRFPLVGPHVFADCEDCHTTASFINFEPKDVDCYSCHARDYLNTQIPSHIINNITHECEECHAMTSYCWDLNFTEHSFFPLIGGHAEPTCYECHKSNVFQNIDSNCYSCHQTNYNSTQDPNHISLNMSIDCSECHTTNPGWSSVNINHDIFYVLTGAHISLVSDCQICHVSGYANTSDECYSCHQSDYTSTQDPNHGTLGFSTNCIDCHNTDPGWNAVFFNHDTYFTLTGAHSFIANDCNRCHSQGYSITSGNCYSCHSDDYNSTSDPNHVQYQFPQDCEECHNTNIGWSPIILDHNSFFPLTGGHEQVSNDCVYCHSTGFDNLLNECSDCHLANYNNTTNPNHINEQFAQDCSECHTTNPGWSPVTFDHNIVFALTGAHSSIQDNCQLCHSSGYSNTLSECSACHLSDYNNTTDPNHVNNQFPTDCSDCHTTNPGWSPVDFNHSTVFALTGAHSSIQDNCQLCHSSGYSNTLSECSACHISNYNNTTDPDHSTNQFPTDCSDCHTTNPGWSPVTFDHNTVFALTGGHSLIQDDCIQCHSLGYTNLSSDCSACHIDDYNSTTDPNHSTNQFPMDCSECHTTNPGWTPSTFDHDGLYFPIYSSDHQGKWDNCSTCHYNPSKYYEFTCFNCHFHNENNMWKKHEDKGVDDYVYDSYSCYDCHPNGED